MNGARFSGTRTKEHQKIMDRTAERFKRLGGMTPALEKKIGF
jgi:hypothetical protein